MDKVVLARRVGPARSRSSWTSPRTRSAPCAGAPRRARPSRSRATAERFLGATPERLVAHWRGRRSGRSPWRARSGAARTPAEDDGPRGELLASDEGPRGARDRRGRDPRPARAGRADAARSRPEPGVMTPALRPAPRDADRGHGCASAPACSRSRRACTRRRRSAASPRRGAGAARRARGLRPRLVRRTGRLAGRRTATASCASRSAAGSCDGRQATLFAGCGIVADSDPDAEWAESRHEAAADARRARRAGP